MVEYHSLVGRTFRLNEKFPVYDSDDNVIGYTSENDIGVVIFDDVKNDDYIEVTVATGEHAGYDGLALCMDDIKKATYIGDPDKSYVYAHGVQLR